MLAPEYVRQIFAYDPETGVLSWHERSGHMRAGKRCGSLHTDGRWQVRHNGRTYLNSRIIWCLVHGDWPDREVDHINRDSSDDRIANLRLADSSQNKINRRAYRNNLSGHPGVGFCKHSGKWVARISVYKKRIFIGRFQYLEDAITARQDAAVKYYGDFGRGGVSFV